jgi:hypothetical protein
MGSQEFNLIKLLKPKTQQEVTAEIKRRLKNKEQYIEVLLEKNDFVIYKIKNVELIKDIIKNFGVSNEDIFFNFYLILDNSVVGFKQIIGVKAMPNDKLNAMDAVGNKLPTEYLEKFT